MSKVLFFLLLPILYPTTFLLRSRTVTQCVIRVMSIKSDICNFRPINTSIVNEDHCYYDMTLSSSRWGGWELHTTYQQKNEIMQVGP